MPCMIQENPISIQLKELFSNYFRRISSWTPYDQEVLNIFIEGLSLLWKITAFPDYDFYGHVVAEGRMKRLAVRAIFYKIKGGISLTCLNAERLLIS